MMETFSTRFRRTLATTLLFVIAPLFTELLVYLMRSEVYPAYLPFFQKLINFGLGFACYGLLFALFAVLLALILSLLPMKPEVLIPCGFFGLFSALTMARLLPLDSGLSLARVMAFAAAALFAITGYRRLKARQHPPWRLLVGACLYCGISASLLPYLFQLPSGTVFAGALLQALLFVALFFAPLKITIGTAIFFAIIFFPSESPIPRFARPNKIEPYRRVFLVGVDGLSPELLFQMAQEGKLPACKQIIANGVSGRLHTLDVPFSPLIWNSIYTGTEPRRHGIMAFTYTRILAAPPFLSLWLDAWTNSDWMHAATRLLHWTGAVQIPGPAYSRSRLKPALWNLADQNGLNSLVVGGWTTFPPEQIRGVYVSEFALIAGKHIPKTYYPEDPELEQLLSYKPDSTAWKEIERYVATDERTHHVAMGLLKDNRTFSFVSTYYSSIDAFGHHYGTRIDVKSTSAKDREEYIAMRDKLYTQMDSRIGETLSLMDDSTLLIVCSDHGWHFDKRQHNYNVDGVLLIYGNRVRKDMNLDAHIYNIAPTVAYALGISPSAEFADVPLRQLFEGIIRKKAPRFYEPQKHFVDVGGDENFQREKMDELKDLQYLNR